MSISHPAVSQRSGLKRSIDLGLAAGLLPAVFIVGLVDSDQPVEIVEHR